MTETRIAIFGMMFLLLAGQVPTKTAPNAPSAAITKAKR